LHSASHVYAGGAAHHASVVRKKNKSAFSFRRYPDKGREIGRPSSLFPSLSAHGLILATALRSRECCAKICPLHGEAYYRGRSAEALFLARRLLFASARTAFGEGYGCRPSTSGAGTTFLAPKPAQQSCGSAARRGDRPPRGPTTPAVASGQVIVGCDKPPLGIRARHNSR
jgi:hypothetical protein